jgi:hypothetical protein
MLTWKLSFKFLSEEIRQWNIQAMRKDLVLKCILCRFTAYPVWSGPKIIKLKLETRLKSQASDWLKWQPVANSAAISPNYMLYIWVWSPISVLWSWALQYILDGSTVNSVLSLQDPDADQTVILMYKREILALNKGYFLINTLLNGYMASRLSCTNSQSDQDLLFAVRYIRLFLTKKWTV